MALQFILGNSGSGKSHRLYSDIIHASVQNPGTRFLVIVPEQFTMQTQKELVRLHPDHGILNIDILSFQRLAHRIFEEVGTDRRTVLEEIGKMLLLRRAAGKHEEELHVLKGNLKKKGYLSGVKSLISEFTQYDIDSEKMEMMLQQAKDRPQLYYKLQDIQVLYHAFADELQGKYITAEETLEALCQVAGQSRILKDSVIAMDGFTGFTPIQCRLMEKLLVLAKDVYITAAIDAGEDFARSGGDHELFCLSKKTIRTVSRIAENAGCEILPPVILGERLRPRFEAGSALDHLEQNLFREKRKTRYRMQKGMHREESISLHTAANPEQEAHFAARTIRRLCREGYRCQDMAVIVGDMEAYEHCLPYVFQKYDIPLFMDQRRTLAANPFVEFLRAASDMILQNFTVTSVFRYLRSGLCDLQSSETDILENYVLAAGIKGYSGWNKPFERKVKRFSDEQILQCEELRCRIMEHISIAYPVLCSGRTTVKDKTTALYELAFSYGIQTRLAEMEKEFEAMGRMDLKKEYAQVYQMIMGLFDKLAELLGEEKMSLAEYTELLETGLSELRVGIIPPSADQIQVGDIERTRLKDIKILFFLGLNDGWVPGGGRSGGLLSDMEREYLKASDVELAPTAKEESYIQKFYLYLNMTKPSERLYLSWCRSDQEGEAKRPSYIVRTIGRMFDGLTVQDEDRADGIIGRVATARNGIDYLVTGLQTVREREPGAEWRELYRWYHGREEYREQAEELVRAAFLTFSEDAIGRKAAKELYGEVLSYSVSRLEKFAGCAFEHFLSYGLNLEEREEYTFRAMDTGNIAHSVLEKFSRRVDDEPEGWSGLTDVRRDQLIDTCVEEVAGDYGGQILKSSARNAYIIMRLKRIMRRTAWALQKQIVSGSFRPANYEVSFRQVRDLESVNITLSEEEKLHLQGRIDRIDVCEKEDRVYVKIIDYKTGQKQFDLLALYYGRQLQLVAYMNAALEMEKRIHPDKEIIPAGIFYYRVNDPMPDPGKEPDPAVINDMILKELKLNGIVNGDPDIYRAMDQNLVPGTRSAVIPVDLKNDGCVSASSKTVTTEQFGILGTFANRKMQQLGDRILAGEIAPVPVEEANKSSCDYCIYNAVCRWDKRLPGTRKNRQKKYAKDEIWKLMEKETDEG